MAFQLETLVLSELLDGKMGNLKEKINSTSAARSEEPMQTTPMDTSMIEEINASEIQENLPEELEPQEVIPATRSNPDNEQTRIAANNEETLTESNLDTVIAKPQNVTTDDIRSTSLRTESGGTLAKNQTESRQIEDELTIDPTEEEQSVLKRRMSIAVNLTSILQEPIREETNYVAAKDKSSSAKDADDDDIILVRALKKQENRDVKLKKWQDRARAWNNSYTAQDFGHTVGSADPGNEKFPEKHVIIYTDGSFNVQSGYGGIGMFVGNGHPLELGLAMEKGLKSSFVPELFAIIVALCRVYCWAGYRDQSIILRTDCKDCVTAISNLCKGEKKELQDNNKKNLEADNRENLKFVQHIIKQFSAKVVLQWVEAHSDSGKHPGNKMADALAVDARKSAEARDPDAQASPQKSQSPDKQPRKRKVSFNESEHQYTKDEEKQMPAKPRTWENLLEDFAAKSLCARRLDRMKKAEDNEEENNDDGYNPKSKLGIRFLSEINV
ncbi:unnamed protein product, partial [Mesorhabditis belari]|uniref:ribonuclease H n=1 Tax=Mesorhabditis belari TaxID=2138241 RepID=A0AAF3JC13_9BILA